MRTLAPSLICLLLAARATLAAPIDDAREALRTGRYAEAEATLQKLLKAGSTGPAALLLGRLQLETGRYAEAGKTARTAAKGKLKAPALTLQGEALRLEGKLPEAEKLLKEAVTVTPKHYRAFAYLGLVYHEQGKLADAKTTFDVFYDDYGDGKIKKDNAEHLTYVAMACRHTDNFRDASDTYRDATKADPKQVEAFLQWAEISLEKYEAGYAEKHYDSVLKINPNHPDALIGLAQVKLEQSNDVEGALKLCAKAEKVNPHHLEAAALRAQVLIDSEENLKAEAVLAPALKRNPNHLGALTMLAASHFLRDDLPGFKKVRDRVLKLNPRYTRFFHEVVGLAVRQHRYQESIELSKQAVKIDPQDWYSLADLGTNHLRLGDDANGLKHLRQAWKGDAFNVRNYNLLNLYDDVVAKEYVFISSQNFKLRVHKQDQELIRRTTIPLLEKAFGIYVKKYKFKPRTPVVVELFRDPSHYAVRTVGLPGLSALGVCFGPLITSTSPLAGRFNWGQVLWHELNHVFTIQMSRSRVPRWLTEGLADMEPQIERGEWKRENDFDIYRAIRSGRLKGLESMNTAFTQAKSLAEIVVAYYQGSLLAIYLIKQYGLEKMLEALRLYGKGKRTEEIIPAVYRVSLAEVDNRFRTAELKRLAYYDRNWYLDPESFSDLDARERAAKDRPADAAAQASLAAAQLRAGKLKEAEAQAQKALGIDARNKIALFVAAEAARARRDEARTAELLRKLVSAGGDGYDARLALGELALAKQNLREAEQHLNQAKRLDPERAIPYWRLAQAYEKARQTDRVIAELRGFAALEQQSFGPILKLVKLLAERKDWAGVRQYGTIGYYIHPASVELHRLLAQAYASAAPRAELEKAVWHLETALLGRSEKPADLHVELARVHLQRKDPRRAKAEVQKALKADPAHAEAKALAGKLR
jgi:predicted Zn-dependent protease